MTIFQKALLQSVLEEYDDLPWESELEDTFSDPFHEWAEGFIRKQRPQRVRARQILRAVLIAAVLLVLLAGTAMAIPAVREAIIDYFFSSYVERIGVTFDPDKAATAPDLIGKTYEFGYIPAEYKLVSNWREAENVTILWTNTEDLLIAYNQYVIPNDPADDFWIGIDFEDGGKKTVLIGGYWVDIIRMENSYLLVWTNNAYFFTLELPNTIDDDTMREIFLSWKPAAQ